MDCTFPAQTLAWQLLQVESCGTTRRRLFLRRRPGCQRLLAGRAASPSFQQQSNCDTILELSFRRVKIDPAWRSLGMPSCKMVPSKHKARYSNRAARFCISNIILRYHLLQPHLMYNGCHDRRRGRSAGRRMPHLEHGTRSHLVQKNSPCDAMPLINRRIQVIRAGRQPQAGALGVRCAVHVVPRSLENRITRLPTRSGTDPILPQRVEFTGCDALFEP